MTKKFTIESSYTVYDDAEGVSIKVAGDADGLGNIRIFTEDKDSKEWFGEIDVTMSDDMAEGVALAILKKVDDMRKANPE